MDVASRARDESLWDAVANRALAGDRVAENILRTWPDQRGAEFFERAFSDASAGENAQSELSAVTFFVRCCRNHGPAPLAAHLGDPWEPVDNERIVSARNWVGAELDDCEESGARVSAAWAEYLASLLLATRVTEEWGKLSRSLALLRRHEDPRLPVLIWRFVHDRIDVEEDIVSCLTSVRSAESKRIARALAEQLSQQATRARGEQARERLERVGDRVASALAAMES